MPGLLNLGCGGRYSTDAIWTNLDMGAADRHVIAHDMRRRLPFDNNIFDGVYHSHVLEHFTQTDGRRFLGECHRVLKPGGVLRVAVPDLAQICRLYLEAKEKSETGPDEWKGRYDWMLLELYDQTVRTTTGGEMASHLRRPDLKDTDFILGRIGNVGRQIMESAAGDAAAQARATSWRQWASRFRHGIGKRFKLALLNEHERQALELGLFRLSGEVHQWMYDDYSLRRLLESASFADVRRCSATESRIRNWNSYGLDVGSDGVEHAPSSLYMEGCKP